MGNARPVLSEQRGPRRSRRTILAPWGLRRADCADAEPVETVSGFRRLGGVAVVIGQMAIKLGGVIELPFRLGAAAGVEQLSRRELGRALQHWS
jgi:hypothetical protein